MTIGDLFGHWEGPSRLVARNGSIVLAINGILAAMAEERTALEEAGFVLKEA